MFGKDIINNRPAPEEDEIEVTNVHIRSLRNMFLHNCPADRYHCTINCLTNAQILIDTAPTKSTSKVWHDEEDEALEIDLTKTSRLKKLRKSDNADKVVTSDVFSNALQER